MEEILNITKEKITFKEKIKNIYDKIFSSTKSSILFLIGILSTVMLFYFFYIYVFNDNYYNNWSDDSLQYYPFMCDFIESIKDGSFSLYSFKNYLGASFFSDTYYIPLDGFTLIILLLSFFMNTEIAMSIVEIVKMILGAYAIAKFLEMKGYSPKVVFLIGLFYFSSSGITCFSCFPCFTSLAFYLPFSLIVTEYFIRGKWQILPLYSFILVLYNYYLAYTAFAFMAFSVLFMLIINKEKWYKVIYKTFLYVMLVCLGLLMSLFIFLPSIKFVLSSTSREVAGGGSLKSMFYMLVGYADIFLTTISSFFKMVIELFKTPNGIFENKFLFSESFIQTRYLYHTMQYSRYVDDVIVMESFFNVEEYYRMLSNTFTPMTPSSFYGYQSNYMIEHFSFYITGMGVLLSLYVWFMKDYKSNVYKILLVIFTIMMLLPFFSYIYSANLEVLYTRWFNLMTIPLLLIVAHVMEKHDIYELKPKKLILCLLIFMYMGILASYHHLSVLSYNGRKASWDELVLTFENSLFYLVVLSLLIISLMLFLLGFVLKISNKKKRIALQSIVLSIFGLSILFIGYIILKKYLSIPKELFDTSDFSDDYYSIDEQMIFQYLIFVTLVLVAIGTFALIKKKKKLFGIIVTIEAVFSACMSFGAGILFSDSEVSFRNMHNISEFCSENIGDVGTYRIYVAPFDNYLETNTARLMPTGTNSEIFHSFIYAETDDVAGLIFDKKDEGQAGKKALNTYSYYLNILLGYKYVVAPIDSSFKDYDPNIFEFVNKDEDLGAILLKFKDYEDFLVYDNFVSTESFDKVKGALKNISREKMMIESPIISNDYIESVNSYFVERDISKVKDETTSTNYPQRVAFKSSNAETVEVDGEFYYRYSFSGDDAITTRSYAINLFGLEDEKEELVENNHIYLEFQNGDKEYLTKENIRSIGNSTFHIPIYGDVDKNKKTPKYLFIYAGEDKTSTPPNQRYTAEAIFASDGYFDEYEETGILNENSSLEAAIKIHIGGDVEDGMINLDLLKYSSGSSVSFGKLYIEYSDHTFVSASKELSISKPIENIYLIKNGDILDLSTPPTLKIMTYNMENTYSDNYKNKEVEVDKTKITISYTNESPDDSYRIIMIPTAYSDEWKLIDGDVKNIIPVNGGFIGIIVNNNIESNRIVIKFKPNGLKTGAIVSIISILIYGLIVGFDIYAKRKKEEKQCKI